MYMKKVYCATRVLQSDGVFKRFFVAEGNEVIRYNNNIL